MERSVLDHLSVSFQKSLNIV